MTAAELRDLRARLGLTQSALAVRLGTAQGRISDWENERRSIPLHAEAHLRTLVELHECREADAAHPTMERTQDE